MDSGYSALSKAVAEHLAQLPGFVEELEKFKEQMKTIPPEVRAKWQRESRRVKLDLFFPRVTMVRVRANLRGD